MGKDLKGKELGTGISQRPDGRYIGRYTDRYRRRKTIYDNNLRRLKKRLEVAKYEANSGMGLYGDEITLEQWFEEFMEVYKVHRVKETTAFRIRQTFSPVKKDPIGMMYLRDIRAVNIQKLINKLSEKGFSFGTLSLLKSLLNEMFKVAVGNKYAIVNPCESVLLPLKENKEPRYLTEQEQKMFLQSAKGYAHYDIYVANLTCGARIGELLGLKWSDIDFENKTISIKRTLHYNRLNNNEKCHFFFTTPKTSTSMREIPLLPETESILKSVRNKQLRNKIEYQSKWHQEEPFVDMVFTTQYGQPVRYGDVNKSIKAVVKKANILEEELAKIENREPFYLESFSPHCFRHTFITNCRNQGVSYDTIQPYVGHSNKEMTAYYDHNKPKMDVDKLRNVSFISLE